MLLLFVLNTSMVFAAATGFASEPSAPPRPACEIFLWPAMRYPGFKSDFPLRTGWLPQPQDMRVFQTVDAAAGYLRDHAAVPRPVDFELMQLPADHVIYVSEFGPSVWPADEYQSWATAVTRLGRSGQAAKSSILRAARGESVDGFGEQGRARLRSAMVIFDDGAQTQTSEVLRQMIAYGLVRNPVDETIRTFTGTKDPFYSPDQLDNMSPIQKALLAMTILVETPLKSDRSQRGRMLIDAQSLNIPFKAGTANESVKLLDDDAIYIARVLLREPLVRRTLIEDGETLRSKLADNEIFLLALHPEYMPIWPQLKYWAFDVPTEKVEILHNYHQSPILEFDDQHVLSLVSRRDNSDLGEARFEETVDLSLLITTYGNLSGHMAEFDHAVILNLIDRLQHQYGVFSSRLGISSHDFDSVRVTAEDGFITLKWTDPAAAKPDLIGFYAFMNARLARANLD